MGAAITTLMTGILTFKAFRVRMFQWTEHPMVHAPLVKHAVAAILTWAFVRPPMTLPNWHEMARFYDLFWFGALVVAVYLALVRIMREFGRADLQAVQALIQPTTAKKQP